MLDPPHSIFGCVLMGGRSRRFGGIDKALLNIGGDTLLNHVIRLARGQVTRLALGTAKGEIEYGTSHGLPILNDEHLEIGPMGGLYAAMKWAHHEASYVTTFACDTPSFPADMVVRLAKAAEANKALIALPRHNGRVHTTLGLWSTALLPELGRSIAANELAITRWAMDNGAVQVDFDDASPSDFFNINSPEDAERYRELIGSEET